MKDKLRLFSRAVQTLILFGLTAIAALAQSGDLSGVTTLIKTLGMTVVDVFSPAVGGYSEGVPHPIGAMKKLGASFQ